MTAEVKEVKETEKEYWARVTRETLRWGEFTIAALAERLGVSDREVVYWRDGQRRPTGFTAIRLYQLRAQIVCSATAYPAQLFISHKFLGE